MKLQYEERLTDLNAYAEELKTENDHLRVDNAEWRARADEYLQQNIALQGNAETLKIENGELLEKVLSSETLARWLAQRGVRPAACRWRSATARSPERTVIMLHVQLKIMADDSREQVAELQAMVEQVKESVQQSLNSFTNGECSAAELQQRLMAAGVQVTCKPELLEEIRSNPEATCVPCKLAQDHELDTTPHMVLRPHDVALRV